MSLRTLRASLFLSSLFFVAGFFGIHSVQAATCTITTDTVVNQAYVDSGSCSAIDINGNVSTTWVGTVDLQGSGTVTVKTTKTMTMGTSSAMVLGSDDDFVIETGGVVTHQAEDPTGVQITARNITITGSINAVGKGCRFVANANGYGPNTATGVCTTATSGYGKSGRGGAAHGGAGGTGGSESTAQTTTYDSFTAPALLGSGGGGTGGGAGTGGGYVKITASGTLTVNGTISVAATAGGPGDGFGNGGGSGGAVMIRALVVAGSGSISANGGNGGDAGGGGGGGRVAIYYTGASGSLLSNVTVARGTSPGGYGATAGAAGTAYFLDRLTDDGIGSLRIGGGFDFPPGDYSRDSITVDPGTILSCNGTSDFSLSATTLRMSGSIWSCDNVISNIYVTGTSAFYATNTTWTFSNASNVVFAGGAIFDPSNSIWTVSKSGSQTRFNIPSSQTLTNFTFNGAANAGTASAEGGRVFLPENISLSLVGTNIRASVVSSTFASLSLDATSSLSTNGRGCQGGSSSNGYGPNLTTGICTITTAGYGRYGRGGAAHGGAGGTGGAESTAQTATYGSSTHPILFGSGGGQISSTGVPGGGIIHLVVTGAFTHQGTISADGSVGNTCDSYGCGAGSGGSVYVYAGSIAGSGSILSRGGDTTGIGGGAGGGGGGGRIAVLFGGGSTSTMTISATGGVSSGGYSSASGSSGTTYSLLVNTAPSVPSALGPTPLVNGSTTGTNNPTFSFVLADPDAGDTVKYQIQIDDSSDFSSPVIDYTSALAAQGARTFQVGQVAGSGSYTVGSASQTLSDTSYYWRVRTIDPASAMSSYAIANSGAVAFIVNTSPHNVQFDVASGSGLESVTATSIRIILNTAHFETVTVDYAVSVGSAEGSGVDYTLAAGTATIAIGETSTTVPFTIVNDLIDESDETFTITLSNPSFAALGARTDYVYTITDNDTAGITVSTSTVSLTEGGPSQVWTYVLDAQPTSTVQLLFTTSTNGLTLSTSALTFTSSTWNVAQELTAFATNDSVFEGTMATSVQPLASSTAYGYASFSVSPVTVSISDNDTVGVTVTPTSLSLVEGGMSDSYTIVLTSQPTSTVQISLSASSDVTLSTSTIAFTPAGWNIPVTVNVSAVENAIDAPTVLVPITHTLSVPSDFALGYSAGVSVATTNVSITDNDTAGVTIAPTSRALSEGGASSTYTIVLNTQPTSTVQVLLAVPSDLTASTSSATFTSVNWNVPQTITVNATQDVLQEGAEAAVITHTILIPSDFAFGYTGLSGISDFTATIADDEIASIAIAPTSLAIREGGTDAYSIVLGTAPTSTVQVLIAASAGVSISTSTISFTESTWNIPVVVTVTPDNNTLYSGPRSATVTNTVSTTAGGYTGTILPAVEVSISDDDPQGGGAAGSGGGGAPQSIFNLIPTTPPPAPAAPVSSEPAPIIIVQGDPAPVIPSVPSGEPPRQIITILNPSDVLSLVQATQSSRDFDKEGRSLDLLKQDAKEFKVPLTSAQGLALSNFITYGISERTVALGEGERRALVRDALETMKTGAISPADLERMTRGIIPNFRNLTSERTQLPRVRTTFRTIFGHDPNFKNVEENLAWNTLMYRIRFPRDLGQEKEGILEFKALFKKAPQDPFQWAAVRVLGYVKT